MYTHLNFSGRQDYNGHFQVPVNKLFPVKLHCFHFIITLSRCQSKRILHSHVIVDVTEPSMQKSFCQSLHQQSYLAFLLFQVQETL